MTETSAIERLRRLLDERDIERRDGDAAYETEWSTPDGRHCSAMYWKPTFTVLISGCTPEQAIDATLGSVSEAIEASNICAERTCHDKHGGDTWCFVCDACGCALPWTDSFNVRTVRGGSLNYCPNCGAKVVD